MANKSKTWEWNDEGFFTVLNSQEVAQAVERAAKDKAATIDGGEDVYTQNSPANFSQITPRVQTTIIIKGSTAKQQAADKTVEKKIWN